MASKRSKAQTRTRYCDGCGSVLEDALSLVYGYCKPCRLDKYEALGLWQDRPKGTAPDSLRLPTPPGMVNGE